MKRGQPDSTHPALSDHQISSHGPDPELAWCANCQAHTYAGKQTVKRGNCGATYQREVCGHCQSYMLWNVPSGIRKSTYGCCGCTAIPGAITLGCVIWGWLYRSPIGFGIAAIIAMLFLTSMGFAAWFVYLHSRWLSWVKRQGT
jgi:hypothetical protein